MAPAPDVATDRSEEFRQRLRAVPDEPGVYLFRNHGGIVIYVGKAVRLRDRLRSYFTPGYAQLNPRIADLLRNIWDFEFIRAGNEVEALVLEQNLIKHYRPRYNVRLKDDKNYLYLKLPVQQDYARVHYARRVQDDGALYFGPYTSAQSLRGTVKSIRRLLPFRTCSDDIFKQGKVCLDFHIQRCPGPCEGRISEEDYRARIQEVAYFMEGRSDHLTGELRQRMQLAAEALDFENAAAYRNQLQAIQKIADRQKVTTYGKDDQDLVAYARQARDVFVELAYIREGKMVGHDGFPLEGAGEATEPELLRSFVLQYYGSATHVPRTVLLPGAIDEPDLLRDWLGQRRQGAVALEIPQRGRKRQLLDQLAVTAAEELRQL
ncbi:MAG: excinuclease ABC subunit UvrC, partial [Candidatus Dormibacteraceae bacterium]